MRPQLPPHVILLDPRQALRCDHRRRAPVRRDSLPRPDNLLGRLDRGRQPSAAPLELQAVLPATVALPPGLVRMLKVKGDYQFFLSASVRPHSALTTSTASRNSSSGPTAASDSGVAGAPSSSMP